VIEQTRIHAALKGVRGRPPVDLLALEQLLVRFSQLVADQPRIREVDINPLLVSEGRMLALDARVLIHEAAVPDSALPALAIRPYPFQYVAQAKLKDGTAITVRPIRPEDEPLIVAFHGLLSPTTVYSRYFEFLQYEQRIAHERLARLSFIDYDREMALVAERRTRGEAGREIIGVGRLIKLSGTNAAEFALVVGDPWQGRGLGLMLLNLLVRFGRDERLGLISGDILPDNAAMKHVAQRAGFRLVHPPGESIVRAELDL